MQISFRQTGGLKTHLHAALLTRSPHLEHNSVVLNLRPVLEGGVDQLDEFLSRQKAG